VRLRPFFSYYGAKWRASKYYPAPEHLSIVEPFAGSACYSLTHYERDVRLFDKDPTIANLWQWLINASPKDVMSLPDTNEGMADGPEKDLIGFWYVRGAVKPAPRPYAWARSGEWDEQFWGERVKKRIASQVNHINHWVMTNACYTEIPNVKATWFVDPPYIKAGKHYVHSDVDYKKLAEWSKSRLGHVIVCEQRGAEWLPFKDFKEVKSRRTGKSDEVWWHKGMFSNCS
jgi:hypothetical protein